MILCSWSILCLNIPDPDETLVQSICRRTWLTALGFLGPEFILQAALGQWASAKQSVKDFKDAQIGEWEMTHAFFSNAGGFVLKPANSETVVPLNARQLLYLVKKNRITLDSPEEIKKTIKDRNKSDGILRAITLIQTTWFVINFITRLIEHLPVSGLEITTVAFMFCALGTSICWWNKPADVTTSIILESPFTMEEIQDGAIPTVYDHTPLDCVVPRQEWHWSRFWQHWINILRWMRIEKVLFVEYAAEAGNGVYISRIENTYWFGVHGNYMLAFLFVAVGYAVIFLSSWNETFPTHIEQTLWRTASVMLAASIIIYFTIVLLWCSESDDQRRARREGWEKRHAARQEAWSNIPDDISRLRRIIYKATSFQWWHRAKAKVRNNSKTNDPFLDLSFKAQLSMYLCAFTYCVARMYLYVADLTQLRLLPQGAYNTIQWPGWFPHIG
ncbi:hypothetical protein CJF31_00005565 [Rutstroemia sp. NJR-2017a BVV2]|nr:hypothetical protein CJF31_00005565 [Rutstroemia sp. NJR-2017a BVV2]